MRLLLASAGATALLSLAACGAGEQAGGAADAATADASVRKCLDSQGNVAADCAVTPVGSVCPGSDDCARLTLEEVRADNGTAGPCLHLVIENRCGKTLYSYTCIEHQQAGTKDWQCWTSTTWNGYEVDVSDCHATGRYSRIHSTSSGGLDILEQQCPTP